MEAKYNKRMGIKVPRSTLLPPYLAINPYFVEFCDAIDEVFGTEVDSKIDVLANIRNMWVQNPNTESAVQAHELIDAQQWSLPEREIVVKQVNMLGMRLESAGVVSDQAYQTIARFVGMYWFGKGTSAFIDFINYCLGSDLRIVTMWTENYEDFLRESDPSIGTPIWEGGTWYPTTHVTIVAKGGLGDLDILTLQRFFYEIANYNLVLKAIDADFDMWIVPDTKDNTADIVAMGLFGMYNVVIANFKNKGAPAPATHQTEVMPSTYIALGAHANSATAFLLAEPTGWMYIDEENTKRVPVYSKFAQNVTDQPDVGITLVGEPTSEGKFNLLYGPVQWVKVPGSTRNQTRIPAFTSGPTEVVDGVLTSARAVGMRRTKLLTNPKGFVELTPGSFVPYW